MKHMRPILVLLAALCAGPLSAQQADPALVAAGKAVAVAGDCAACHTNPEGKGDFAGGYGVDSPLGTIYGANITPSPQGIGDWSFDQFDTAMRKGRAPDLHFLYPAMPYTAYAGMAESDMKALYSYLQLGVDPSDNVPPHTDLGFPFSFRAIMAGWNLLFLNGDVVAGANAEAGSAARGEYLVKTLAHCSTCHTPRNALMGEESDSFLGGGAVGEWIAPNITAGPDGIGDWSRDDIARFLATGRNAHGVAGGEMGTAVERSFSKMPRSDLDAIAAYLVSVPAVAGNGPVRGARDPASIPDIEPPLSGLNDYIDTTDMSGARLYQAACATCHGWDGMGSVDGAHPALVGNTAVALDDPGNLVMTILNGAQLTLDPDASLMPAFGDQFTDAEVAKLASYVRTGFGAKALAPVTQAQVWNIRNGVVQTGWLLANAKALTIAGLGLGALILIAGLAVLIRRRRRIR
ncbi:Fructose dehydrogenase cytochrome subunit precursor [Aquimixticola soesokkakensis]|uniref:Fructose dehydrogenase cytochrome subunit n=1 Tax=Aquimixticola soesokkakensis TaxID=1519096 RepID=A0A1Y5RRQ9_9RHOB|nr:c-type cytochrome [Aquimixticola soesokkakensis]SLN22861.1 Fructose dehydrogenase cytochrome subunit precursor [Aquimixticola soesokkakensis]